MKFTCRATCIDAVQNHEKRLENLIDVYSLKSYLLVLFDPHIKDQTQSAELFCCPTFPWRPNSRIFEGNVVISGWLQQRNR